MKLLCYDTLLVEQPYSSTDHSGDLVQFTHANNCSSMIMMQGGFLTSYWLGRQEPRFDYPSSLNGGTSGAGRYKERCLPRHLRTIQQWGGWSLFQELLAVLSIVADRHSGGVSVGTVAQRWVLDQRAVGAIVTSITERGKLLYCTHNHIVLLYGSVSADSCVHIFSATLELINIKTTTYWCCRRNY